MQQHEQSQVRPRRSVLYMPGSNARALEKAKSLDVDALIFDLEDAVDPEAKELARDQVCTAVVQGGYGHRELVVRINSLHSPLGQEDMLAVAKAQPDGVLVPKLEGPADVRQVLDVLDRLDGGKQIALWLMMETPGSVLYAREIAEEARNATRPVAAMVLGTNDLAKDTRAALEAPRTGFLPWLMQCVVAARYAGIDVIDGVFNQIGADDTFLAECEQGRNLGMDGKTLIHPSQIAAANASFAPSEEEITWAGKVIAAFDAPENEGKGVLKVDGKMVELLHAQMGRRLIDLATAIEMRRSG
ncbi:HpcH/HpaI aldolase/citrate lyase family protein [Polycladidibacter hongkongensis]|uniref:HpcH/HpaI aldolase/citrate lyase family protein n=1 Tax=Polycladidibacter hongkongensis TaxID=1647556 RepID=UPI00082A50E7|nr:CoA ester lyase [Pseudovibrio hongkongensis]